MLVVPPSPFGQGFQGMTIICQMRVIRGRFPSGLWHVSFDRGKLDLRVSPHTENPTQNVFRGHVVIIEGTACQKLFELH